MKYTYFKKKVEELGMITTKSDVAVRVRTINGAIILKVFNNKTGVIDSNYFSFEQLDDEIRRRLVVLATELALTPKMERNEDDLYRVEFHRSEHSVCLLRRECGGSPDISHDLINVENATYYRFTEDEIKGVDKRYWAFAVPIDNF